MRWKLPYCPDPGESINWENVLSCLPCLCELDGCDQDPEWHGEGDVLSHTRLVTKALVDDPDWQALTETLRHITFTAALLHDIAKPTCSHVDIDGRIRAPNHGPKGARRANRILYGVEGDLPVAPLAVRVMVSGLIRRIGAPVHAWGTGDATTTCITVSQHVPNHLVTLLARADVQGRQCPDKQQQLEAIELYTEHCQELGCWSESFSFASEAARWTWLKNPAQSPQLEPFDDHRCTVTLLAGLPATGKDHWVKQHRQNEDLIHLDAIRQELGIDPAAPQASVVANAKARLRASLRNNRDVIWNATNLSRRNRASIIQLCTQYRARSRIVFLDAPWAVVQERNLRRDSNRVPSYALHDMIWRLDFPSLLEAWDLQWTEGGLASV